MYYGKYLIAGHVVGINSVCPDVHKLCAGYKTDLEAEFEITLSSDDVEYERRRSALSAEREGHPPYNFSDGYLEQLAAYRRIAEHMIEYDTVLIHGSAIAVDGEAYVFIAKSGTGKSTHTALWRRLFGDRAVMVNDDKPLVHIGTDGVTVYGTPYNGKHHLGENISAPLRAICVLERAAENTIRELSKAQAYSDLVQQTYRPRGAAQLAKTLSLIDRMADKVRLFRLGCNMDIEAAKVSYDGMNAPQKQ